MRLPMLQHECYTILKLCYDNGYIDCYILKSSLHFLLSNYFMSCINQDRNENMFYTNYILQKEISYHARDIFPL